MNLIIGMDDPEEDSIFRPLSTKFPHEINNDSVQPNVAARDSDRFFVNFSHNFHKQSSYKDSKKVKRRRQEFFQKLHKICGRLIHIIRRLFPQHPFISMAVIKSPYNQSILQHLHTDFMRRDKNSRSLLFPLHKWVNILARQRGHQTLLRVNSGQFLVFNNEFTHGGGINDTEEDLYRIHFYICKDINDLPSDEVYTDF